MNSWTRMNDLAALVGAHKEPDWKVCDKVTWGRGRMKNLWLWV